MRLIDWLGIGLLATLGALSVASGQQVTNPSPTATVCAYNSSPPTITSGQFAYAQCDNAGTLKTTASVTIGGTTSNASDGVATSSTNLTTVNYPYLWNGATFDRWKGDATNGAFVNVKTSVLPTGAASATNQSTANASLASIDTKTLTLVADPCQANAKTSIAISQAASTKLFSQVSAKKNYICSFVVVTSDAENLSLVEGTGSTCGTNTAGIIGGTTAAAGPNLAANGGFTSGSGLATIASGTNANFDVCLLQSASGRVAGVLTYVQQ